MRPQIDSTAQPTAQPHGHPPVHVLDEVWLLTIVAILLAIGIPWLSGGFEVQVGVAGWAILALGAIHIAFTFLASPSHAGRWRDRSLTLLNAIGVMLIGFVWAHVGALQNPLFLMVFVLPVVGSVFLSRWHPFLIALVSVLVVGIVALSQTPELRSYVSGLLGTGAWLVKLFGRQGPGTEGSFAGFYAPMSYLVTVLQIFTIV